MDLQFYLTEWNRTHQVQFYLSVTDDGSPRDIMVYYPKEKGPSVYADWKRIVKTANQMSYGTMVVSSSHSMSKTGIIEFRVMLQNEGYSEETIMKTLKWIGATITAITS